MRKRIVVEHYGGPETLQVIEEQCTEPKRGEVRVRVLAAGVALPRCTRTRGYSSRNAKGAIYAWVGPDWIRRAIGRRRVGN